MGTRSPLTCFLDGDKIKILKIVLSPCLANISDGDKISIEMFFEWRQNRDFENYLIPMLSKYFWWGHDPNWHVFLKGQDKTFKSYFVPIICKDFWRGQDRTSDNYPPCLVNNSDGDMIPIEMFFEWGQDRDFKNYLVPMPSKYFWWGQDPHWDVFWMGTR